MKVVIDANVIIASAAARGLCEAIMELCLEHHHIILCEGIISEVEEKLNHKIKVPAHIIAEYIGLLRNNAQILTPDKVEEGACRDPKDLMVLGLATTGNADAIITGDKDLLDIKEYYGVPIMTPRSFWENNKKDNKTSNK